VRIVHFSDVHFGRFGFSFRALLDKRLLGMVNFMLNRRGTVDEDALPRLVKRMGQLDPDLVVCSGDITCVGTPAEFAAATQALSPLSANPRWRFVYVPGNHDAYVAAKACRRAMEQAEQALNPGQEDAGAPFRAFQLGGVNVALVKQAHPTNIFLSTGAMGREASARLKEWCAAKGPGRSAPKLLVGHFPTSNAEGAPLGWRRQLNGAATVARELDEGNIGLYLCGHIHSPFLRKFPSGAIQCCSGSLTIKGSFAVIDMEPDGNVVHRWGNVGGPEAPRKMEEATGKNSGNHSGEG
jgi:DNA repair exonuclease SbcCD nuclease subunit